MLARQFDAIVVGAGIIGSTTAFHLQKAGRKTLLIDQFTLGHTNGSSHGQSRIIKLVHAEAAYVELVREATKQIRELEKKRGEQLITVNERGGFIYGTKERMERTAAMLERYGEPCELLTAEEARERFPHYQYGDNHYTHALVDPQMGLILADRWISAFQDEFKQAGGSVVEKTLVEGHKEEHDSVTITTTKGEYSAAKVIYALGSWINKFLPGLPVKGRTELISVCYWAPKDPADAPLLHPSKYSPHIAYEPDGRSFLSMGSVDVPGAVKFILHGGQVHEDTDVPVEQLHEKFVEDVRAHIAGNVPFLDTANGPVKVERCKYTLSPDAHYVIDYLPGSRNIQVAGCMSGTGFKNSPAVGRAVAQIAMGEQPFMDMSFFSLDRFKNENTSSE